MSFQVTFLDDYTEDTLCNEVRRVAAESAKPTLSIAEFLRLSNRVSASTIRRRFGSWQAALEKAGLPELYGGREVSMKMKRQPARRLSNDDLLDEMRRVQRLVGRPFLTVADFNNYSVTSVEAVRRRFGTWAKALSEAGIAQAESANKRWSDEVCFENLASVWTYYGRTPTFREMFNAPSTISGKAYETRWRTWRNAIRAFVTWAEAGFAATPQLLASEIKEAACTSPAVVRRSEADQRQVGARLRFQVVQQDRFKCVACGRSPANDTSVVLHADHIIPVALRGRTVIENLQTLCGKCNLGKGKLPGHDAYPG